MILSLAALVSVPSPLPVCVDDLHVIVFRARKVLENRNMGVEDQLSAQETQLRSVKESAEERDRMYEEV